MELAIELFLNGTLTTILGAEIKDIYDAGDGFVGIQYLNDEDQCNECLKHLINVNDLKQA